MAALAPPGCPCQPLFPRAADRRWYWVEIGLSGSPSRPARAAHAPGPTAFMRKPSAPQARQRPPRARHRAVNSTPTRHPCSATDGAAANSPPVRSRSRLLAIDFPRLVITTTGWGPGRYAARASAGPIRNSILSKHLRQLGDVRRDAAGLVPPRPACA
jgi:hypothetical protein